MSFTMTGTMVYFIPFLPFDFRIPVAVEASFFITLSYNSASMEQQENCEIIASLCKKKKHNIQYFLPIVFKEHLNHHVHKNRKLFLRTQ